MDNLALPPAYVDYNGELVQEAPRAEVLATLYGILAAYDASPRQSGVICPLSISDAAEGLTALHRLRHGCCRDRVAGPNYETPAVS